MQSVFAQTYSNYEHLIIDGRSTDLTVVTAKNFDNPRVKVFSERDNGIYDAMNKGFKLSQGDVIAFLNSDDYYFNDTVFETIVNAFQDPCVDFVFGDILMIDNHSNVSRYWRTSDMTSHPPRFQQIPHPGLFVRKNILQPIDGPFDCSYLIAADLKQQLIFINKYKSRGFRISSPIAYMSLGGESTKNINGYLIGWKESARAYNEVFGSGGFLFTLGKVASKISQIFYKRLF
jgi:glycosyltransferase